jgi:hypothetical protein
MEGYEKKLISFQIYVMKLRKQHEYPLGQIRIGGKTLVFFDMPESTAVNSTGK